MGPKHVLSQIEFETHAKDAKGASTEDSALKILANLAKASRKQFFVVERPSPLAVGEFDAICCTDSGLINIEVKRFGGCFYEFDILDRDVCIQSARTDRWIPNPSHRLAEKSKRLRDQLKDDGWLRVKRLFSGHVPVSNVVCYGPSTSFDVVPDAKAGNYVCNTRNLATTVWNIFATSRAGVVGAGAQMASLASTWVQWGVLTTNQKGFLRCSISRITSSEWDASSWGLQSVQSDGKSLSLSYENGLKRKLPFDDNVWLKAYVDGQERTVSIDPGSRFRWRIKGR